MKNNIISKKYDVVVVGGGLSGVCAAIACARHGGRTALIHNRPVLGGNASSEIRMHVGGADCHGSRPNARETGIIEEIMLENKKRNPQHSFSIFDTILWEKASFQENLDLYLNTHMYEVSMNQSKIKKVLAEQQTTEKTFEFEGEIFVDATGDGSLAFLAGAKYMTGREGKDKFGEELAPEKSDDCTMGNTLMFTSKNMGYPVEFEKPFWASTYTDDDLLGHEVEFTSGYWWIELGGDETNIINDGEVIRDELLKAVYGIWDHIKNGGRHGAENFALDWVQFLPGKRESRRIEGDYILKEQDLVEGRIFEDAVAYGGWHLDLHPIGGLKNVKKALDPEMAAKSKLKDVYTIPYRSLYSKNIENLLLGGRAISVSHVAFGSTRVMATCALVGQAVGTASALAVEKNLTPREMFRHIKELQQILIKDDCYIPGVKSEDTTDVAKYGEVSCSSSAAGYPYENVINGISRTIKEQANCWVSEPLGEGEEWICLDFGRIINPGEIRIKFDSNLSREYMISTSQWQIDRQMKCVPPELVKDYRIEFFNSGEMVYEETYRNNYQRLRIHKIDKQVSCNKIKLSILSTNGDAHARVFEISVLE